MFSETAIMDRGRPAGGMAWAVDARSSRPTYIGALTREQTGLKCACICPKCNAQLQAVNAGSDFSSGRLPFFRHHNAQQGPGCKYRVAELAALRLLAERGLIEIPAQRKTATYIGSSGKPYEAEVIGEAISEMIVDRRMVSDAQVILTLASGREVIALLRGHQEVGEFGSVLAVIEIEVNDPEAAWMSPDEILARSTLDGEWMRVAYHQDDERLSRLAGEEARNRALQQLDINPEDFDLPVGATKKQAAESLLHWAVKDALLGLDRIQSPAFKRSVTAVEEDGELHTVEVFVPSTWISIAEVADEVLFDGYRPDIVCVGRAEKGFLGKFRLSVEVAVTHKVTLAKMEMIERDDVACMELDVMRFGQGGQVSLSQLRQLVAEDVQCKAWLHHPRIRRMLVDAQLKADAARDASAARKEAERAAERAREAAKRERERQARIDALTRQEWASTLDRPTALTELRHVLENRWAGRGTCASSNGMVWERDEFERATSHVIAEDEIRTGVLTFRGIARHLSKVIHATRAGAPPLDYKDLVSTMEDLDPWGSQPWIALLHQAIDLCAVDIRQDQKHVYATRRQQVLESLREGKATYVRPAVSDSLLVGMFPELGEIFEHELGTERYRARVSREREAAKGEAEAAAKALAAAEEVESAARDAEIAAEAARENLLNAIEQITYSANWCPNLKVPANAGEAVRFLSLTSIKNPDSATIEVVKAGWSARSAGASFSEWFSNWSFDTAKDAFAASRALEGAYLIEPKHRRN